MWSAARGRRSADAGVRPSPRKQPVSTAPRPPLLWNCAKETTTITFPLIAFPLGLPTAWGSPLRRSCSAQPDLALHIAQHARQPRFHTSAPYESGFEPRLGLRVSHRDFARHTTQCDFIRTESVWLFKLAELRRSDRRPAAGRGRGQHFWCSQGDRWGEEEGLGQGVGGGRDFERQTTSNPQYVALHVEDCRIRLGWVQPNELRGPRPCFSFSTYFLAPAPARPPLHPSYSPPPAILADEMGLGKTAETLSFLAMRKLKNPKLLALIVVPVSYE